MRILSFISKLSSTEYAIFDDGRQATGGVIEHSQSDLHLLLTPPEQGLFRYRALVKQITDSEASKLEDIDLLVTEIRLDELPPGVYLVDKELLNALKNGKIEENHLRSGVYVAHHLADYVNSHYDTECMPLVVEPDYANEILPEASLSGIKEITRTPFFHTFSQRAAAYLYAGQKGCDAIDIRAVVAYLGTEISVGAHDLGRITDCNSPLDGEGPFSPTASGNLPVDALVRLCYSGKYDMDEMLERLNRQGGLRAYLPSAKLADVKEAWKERDETTCRILEAMAYQIAREIGIRASAINNNKGTRAEVVILTGPWALFGELVEMIEERVSWIAPVEVHVWESELFMLAVAALETYRGKNKIMLYRREN